MEKSPPIAPYSDECSKVQAPNPKQTPGTKFQNFHGHVPLISTYVGQDVSVQIRVYSGSGALLGMYARRFITTPP